MIDWISRSRCIDCDVCIRVCPNDVFAKESDGVAVIARPEDCHTCFLCELYCPVDAIYVAPTDTGIPTQDEPSFAHDLYLGSYAHASGWVRGRPRMNALGDSHVNA
jgi:NAD-dependent dihydropyrimidine dehydrogenase PreA subunit